jgi:hypothetical protein
VSPTYREECSAIRTASIGEPGSRCASGCIESIQARRCSRYGPLRLSQEIGGRVNDSPTDAASRFDDEIRLPTRQAFFHSAMFQVSLSNGRKSGPVNVFALPLENFRSTSGTDA